MRILGISAFYHDSAAALVVDGNILAAAQEERFSRKKHDASFPGHAVSYCLEEAGISLGEVDYVVFYEKPLLKFDRLMETYLAFVPRGFASFRMAIPALVGEKLFLRREILTGLRKANKGTAFKGHLAYTNHHESHAASAFFPSPFEEAAILCADGVGEWTTTSVYHGSGNRIRSVTSQKFPHSLGLLYSAFTYYTGFKVNSGEYKLMGLAPYGEPVYADRILKHIIDLKEDGSFRLDLSYFEYCTGLRMTGRKFHRLFGRSPRKPESPIDQFHMEIAASIQLVTEKAMLAMAAEAHRRTGVSNLCLAGGVALNCVANGELLRHSPFENVWVQPAAGDAGGALGAALFTWHQLLEKPRSGLPTDRQKGTFLGPGFSDEAVARFLDGKGAVYSTAAGDRELASRVAGLIADGNVIGWFQGRMEFGPRALGGRSILGDPRSPDMQTTMNLKIKFRESFRPFAPSVLRERVQDYFDVREHEDSPYMLQVAQVAEARRLGNPEELKQARGFEKLGVQRSTIPAVTHVDHSARIQTVDAERHPLFHQLLVEFESLTGCPLLINTSFNVRGEPIVCSPEDAYTCFMATHMDVLVIGNHVLLKTEQPGGGSPADPEQHLAKFDLD